MKLKTINLDNVGIIPSLEIPVGSVVWIYGDNGVGKTTIVRAVRCGFNGGHYPDLIGPAGDKAVLLFILDDGTTIKRTITKKSSTYLVLRPDGSKMDDQAEYVKSLCSGLTLDPTALVHAEKSERLKFLQRAIDIRFSREEIEQATGGIHPEHQEGVALKRFEEILQGYIERRREANGKRDSLDAHRKNLLKDIPQDTDKMDWAKSANNLGDKVAKLRAELETLVKDINAEARNAELEAERERDRKIAEARQQYQEQLNKISAAKAEAIREQSAALNDALTEAASQHAAAQERATSQSRVQGLKQSLEKLEVEVKAAKVSASKLDTVVERLRELHKLKLEQMPVPGLEVRDGEIFYEGKNFDTQLNTAMQYIVAFKIARAGSSGLPFFIFDNAEAFSSDTREQFIEAVKEIGYQVVMASVADGKPLTVTSA